MSRIRTIKPQDWGRVQEPWSLGQTLYVVEEVETGLIKVGIASHPTRRLSALQGGNPRELALRAVYVGSRKECLDVEHALLRVFPIVRNEWLKADLQAVLKRLSDIEGQP